MTDIRFYHLTARTLDQALPALLHKALQGGRRIVVRGTDEAEIERLNAHLWAYDPASFIPHGSHKDGYEADQPVWLGTGENNPNGADTLILIHGAGAADIGEFPVACEMFDGRDETAVAAARTRWKTYKDAGHALTYWQQSPQGGWEEKAS